MAATREAGRSVFEFQWEPYRFLPLVAPRPGRAALEDSRTVTRPALEAPSAAWLTGLIADGPALTRGAVASLEVLDRKPAGAMGEVNSVAVRYAPGSEGELPARVVLKRTRPDVEFNAAEVRFYAELAPKLAPGTAPRCFGGVHSEETRQYALVLEDLSESHECLLQPGAAPIGLAAVGEMMECLAALHASWWERPLEGFGRHAADPVVRARQGLVVLGERYPALSLELGDLLEPAHDALYQRYFAERSPALVARLRARSAFALLHGDAHVGNFLFARKAGGRAASASGPAAVLIDWGVFRVAPALWDVSFALMWTAAECCTRPGSEALLRRYHERLVDGGVRGYAWDACVDDFRNALLDNLRAPIGQLAVPQLPRDVPFRAHTAAMALIEAWECVALFDGSPADRT